MFRLTRPSLRAITVAASALVALSLPSAALADGGGTSITLGPMKLAHGWKVQISSGCNSKYEYGSISYYKGPLRARDTHYYSKSTRSSGGTAKCSLSKKLGSGSLRFNWGVVKVNVKIKAVGAKKSLGKVKGCTPASLGIERPIQATGTLKSTIHRGVFGKLSATKITGSASRFNTQKCTPTAYVTPGTFLNAGWSNGGMSASLTKHGHSLFLNAFSPDRPAKNIFGSMTIQLSGPSVFTVASMTSAHIGGHSPLVTGSFNYSAPGTCPGTTEASRGTLTGTMVVHDPIVKLALNGADALPPVILTKSMANNAGCYS